MFIVKKHYEATVDNIDFAGNIHDVFYGKQETRLDSGNGPIGWLVREYGYSTKAAAVKGLKKAQSLAEWETSYGMWNITASIVEI